MPDLSPWITAMSRSLRFPTPWLACAALLLGAGLAACSTSNSSGAGEGGLSGSDVILAAKRKPFISAHRGGAAYAPEDTMTAYFNAQRLAVDDFETDTQLTRDDVLVLIHDATLDRTTNCTGTVISKTYAEIRACDAGFWWAPNQPTTAKDETLPHPYRGKGVYVPKAAELFEYAATLGTATAGPTVTIEIKNIPGEANFEPACTKAAGLLVPMIQKSGIKPRVIVQSFDNTCIDTVKRLDRDIQTLYLTLGGAAANVAYCRAMNHQFASPSYTSPDFTAQTVTAAHMVGVKVNPYTVDTEAAMKTVTATGTDGFITNYPACAMKLAGETPPAVLTAPEAGGGVTTLLCGNGTGTS